MCCDLTCRRRYPVVAGRCCSLTRRASCLRRTGRPRWRPLATIPSRAGSLSKTGDRQAALEIERCRTDRGFLKTPTANGGTATDGTSGSTQTIGLAMSVHRTRDGFRTVRCGPSDRDAATEKFGIEPLARAEIRQFSRSRPRIASERNLIGAEAYAGLDPLGRDGPSPPADLLSQSRKCFGVETDDVDLPALCCAVLFWRCDCPCRAV